MIIVKKLIFAPIFLIFFVILLSQLSPLLKSYDFIFALSLQTFVQIVTIAALIGLASFSFVLFATFAFDWKFILPVAILTSSTSLVFLDQALGVIFAVMSLIGLVFIFIGLSTTLKTYLTFQPATLLGPPIRHLSSLLITIIAICYFLSINKVISSDIASGKGFQIPDSLIDTALKFTPLESVQEDSPLNQLPSIPPQQLELLKQNPELLEQYGLDPKILDSLTTQKTSQAPKDFAQGLIKQTLKQQLNKIIEPYLPFIPAGLAVLLFLVLQSLTSFINLLGYPLLWGLFYILEKSGFIKYTTEQRPVKKIVI